MSSIVEHSLQAAMFLESMFMWDSRISGRTEFTLAVQNLLRSGSAMADEDANVQLTELPKMSKY